MMDEAKKTTVTGVEMFRKLLDEGQAGDNVGVLLEVLKKRISRGQVLAKIGSIKPHTTFKAEVYVQKKVVDIRLSLTVTDHNFILELLT